MKRIMSFLLVAILLFGFSTIAESASEVPSAIDAQSGTDYANADNWAYFGIGEGRAADVFLICPTVDMKDEFNMSLEDEDTKASFLGALNMERGIYEDTARLYAPYYRQAAMKVYSMEPYEREPWLALAYEDISAAFDWYLSTLGSCDCRSLSRRDKLLVLNAVEMCGMLAYTNAVPDLKALAYNANGIYREEAIKTVLNFSSVDDATTMFVEGIVTNDVKFGMVERGDACGVYAHNIMTRQATNDVQRAAKERAWKMLYRHRMLDLIGTGILDSLFVSQIQGYESSSNRLEFAEYVLSHPWQ